ncbi:unnamed protein product [Rodentolepis nana]|uniref:Vesicle transport protein SEC20 n=1 Tax=Rodentolepis nana TaxID=102285 RepID=A0A0R3TZL6_RODNA|nr:unnamed protein product [Rodentolepis nana]
MSTRLVFQQCVGECSQIQEIIASILGINDKSCSIDAKRKLFDNLQSDARKHLSNLKSFISKLDQTFELTPSPENIKKLKAVEGQYASIQESYRKAIYTTSKSLEIAERTSLISESRRTNGGDIDLRNQLQASLELTADMRVHARRLAEEVARGSANAEMVDESSNQVETNLRGLKEMGGQLNIASRLGARLSKRFFIDCFIFLLVFGFFYLSVAHIVLKRLYLYRLFGM